MDYSEVIATAFLPRPAGIPVPEVVAGGGPARRLRDACEPVAMHAVWSAGTNAALAAHGLDFMSSYVGGRATSLGQPNGAVVASAFAWFEPALVATLYDAAAAALPHAELVSIREEATVASLRAALGVDDPSKEADLLAAAAESAEGAGRPLFSGLLQRGRPSDPVHRLWWACDLVREHRGDSHVAAANLACLGPVEMNVLTELWVGMPLLSYTATRGWSPEAMQAAIEGLTARGCINGEQLTESGRALRASIEADTDAQEHSIVDALGDRVNEVCAQLEQWSTRCIEAGAFPPDILKRAAG